MISDFCDKRAYLLYKDKFTDCRRVKHNNIVILTFARNIEDMSHIVGILIITRQQPYFYYSLLIYNSKHLSEWMFYPIC